MIRLPSTLYFGLVISASHYPSLIGKDLTLLCHVNLSARIELPVIEVLLGIIIAGIVSYSSDFGSITLAMLYLWQH